MQRRSKKKNTNRLKLQTGARTLRLPPTFIKIEHSNGGVRLLCSIYSHLKLYGTPFPRSVYSLPDFVCFSSFVLFSKLFGQHLCSTEAKKQQTQNVNDKVQFWSVYWVLLLLLFCSCYSFIDAINSFKNANDLEVFDVLSEVKSVGSLF